MLKRYEIGKVYFVDRTRPELSKKDQARQTREYCTLIQKTERLLVFNNKKLNFTVSINDLLDKSVVIV